MVNKHPLTVQWLELLFDSVMPKEFIELHLTEKQDDNIAFEFVTTNPDSVLHKLVSMLDIKPKHRERLHNAVYDRDEMEMLPPYIHRLGRLMHLYMKSRGY